MRFTERLRGLKSWVYKELCEGREMKAPAPGLDISVIATQEPTCYLGWAPLRVDNAGNLTEIPLSTVPGILIMPNQAYAKYIEGKRFDRYNNVNRNLDMGQNLAICMLFAVYEPGVRLPGFAESAGEMGAGLDITRMIEGTEQGLFTLMNWMDDCISKLLGQKIIPHTDLGVQEDTVTYSLYAERDYVMDKRPIYYGFVNVNFTCNVNEEPNAEIERLLS